MRIVGVRVLAFSWLAVSLAAVSLEAAVVVVGNRSEKTVRFTLVGGWRPQEQFSLAPARLIPVPVPDRVEIRFASGGSDVRQTLDPNTIHEFVADRDGVKLRPLDFGMVGIPPSVAPARPGGPPSPVVVPVKLVAEEDQADGEGTWERQLRRQVAAASQFIELYCGVRFEVVAVGIWKATKPKSDPRRLLDDFREKVSPDPGWLAIGLAGPNYRMPEHLRPLERGREPLCGHVLVPGTTRTLTEAAQLELLVHELGHWLGAVHTREPDSIMRPPAGRQAGRREGQSTFDPMNTLVMNLYADELRARRPPSVDALSGGTREHLYAIYLEAAMRLPTDREITRYAELVREPVLPELRYVGQWMDGTRATGSSVAPWHETKASPKLAGRDLFDPTNPIRWLVDNSVALVPPESWVEFIGGDCLPGRVVGFRDGQESPRERLAPHLLVVPQQRLDTPDAATRPSVRVTTSWVRRIVWEPVADEYRPRTLFFADGRQLDFRALRFAESSVRLLREDGIREVPLGEIAELHLAVSDPWEAYFEQVTALAPEPGARLVCLETGGGLRVTSTTERFQATVNGPADKSSSWYHLVHPAWSLDALWLGHDSIRVRQYFAPHEVPLSRIEPSRSRQQSDLGGTWRWQADRNCEGAILECGGTGYPWGFGVHASCELEFPLPAGVRAFRTRLGLDQLAGNGGCVQARVLINPPAAQSLYTSGVMVGSAEVADTGRLAFDPQKPPTGLILQVDATPKTPPAGADPLDVRDAFNWLEPLVELDPERLPSELLRRGPRMIPCWQNWTMTSADSPTARLVSLWDEYGAQPRGYRLAVSAAPGPVRVSGKVTPWPYRDRLMVCVCRPPNVPGSKLEVRVDGKPLGSFEVPVRQSPEFPPLVFSVAEYHGRDVAIDLIQSSADEKAVVEWRAISLVGRTQVP